MKSCGAPHTWQKRYLSGEAVITILLCPATLQMITCAAPELRPAGMTIVDTACCVIILHLAIRFLFLN
jgi:hypothetical protein